MAPFNEDNGNTEATHSLWRQELGRDNEFSLGYVLFQSEDVAEVQAEDDKALHQSRDGEEQTYFRYTSEADD